MAEANALTDRQREYREVYLRSDHWRQTRLSALERAGHRCQVCNKSSALDVHHRTYERIGHEELSDLTVLCRGCHDIFHEQSRVTSSPKRSKRATKTPVSACSAEERELHGSQIVIALTAHGPQTSKQLSHRLGYPQNWIAAAACRLRSEGVIERRKNKGKRWTLASGGEPARPKRGQQIAGPIDPVRAAVLTKPIIRTMEPAIVGMKGGLIAFKLGADPTEIAACLVAMRHDGLVVSSDKRWHLTQKGRELASRAA